MCESFYPEAEIVAADVTLRTMGLPALSIWETMTGKSPKLLFHDDNQGMIGVVRSGKNPTMRHLERTHGISITSMHEHFKKSNYVLMYEVTSKMAADIHTKGFKNPLAWKRACMLINLLDQGDLCSKELSDLVKPTTDVDTTVRQVFQSRTKDVPNFPYTETPILPPEVYQKGLSAKEHVQQLPGMDPILVVKTPVYFRRRPPGLSLSSDCLRSTWILTHGKWEKIEDRASPLEQQDRFDRWVERACFQYHPIAVSVPTPWAKSCVSPVPSPRGPPASPERPGSTGKSHVTCTSVHGTSSSSYPRLTGTTSGLFVHETTGDNPTTVHAAPSCTARVINTLLRVVHGGSSGWGSPPHGFPDNLYPTENQDPMKNRIIFDDIMMEAHRNKKSRRDKKHDGRRGNTDVWKWEDESTLVRVHNEPRRRLFIPKEAEFLPCRLRRIKDDRRTVQKFQSNNRIIDDSWRMAGSNVESTNRRNEFWTGETRFQVIPNEQWDRSMVEDTDSEDVGSTRSRVVTCTHGDQMDIIPLNDMFISHQYKLKNVKGKDHGWDIEVTLHRKSGKKLVYHFQRSSCDILACLYRDHTAYLDLYEMKDETPCLLLMCAEEQSLFTKVHHKDRFKLLHIVTITENDNLLSPYGRAKWKRCLRTSSDCVFFAGPCTGGSPWNRLNKRVSEETASNIEWKAFLYWELWEEFADCLNHAIYINAMALLELPKGCDYWRDKRMTDMINGTDSHTHEFDGCMYGLKSKYNKIGTPIKKPWRIISWGVSFNKLHEKCDGSHAHGPCAGRETRITQLYTEQIVKIILKGVKNQMLLNNAYGIKRNLKPKMTSVCQALSCIQVYHDHTSLNDQVQQGFQFLHFLHCGSFRLKVKEWFPGLRQAPLPDPDSFWTAILATSTMASTSANMTENEVKTLTGVKATMRTITMLDVLRRRGVASQLPGRFTLSHEENGPITDVAVNKWLDSVKIPVVVVVSLTFASRRRNLANVTHALQLLARTFRECTIRGELTMNAETYVGTASRMMKAFVSKFREGLEAQNLELLCSPECANHAEDLWSVLKEKYAVLIGGGKTVSDLCQLLTSSNVTELGALNTTHPPANSFVEQIRRGSFFLKTNQETWSRRPREITQRPSDDEINFMYGLVAEMKSELANVGYALRRHNAKHPDDRDRQIIIQDVIRDWIEFKYDLTIERAAAVTHLQTTVMLATVLQSWERALDLFDPYKTVIFPVREALRKTFIQLTKALDIPEDIWAHGGYHIMLADNGAYQAVTDRNEALSHFRNYLTTMSDTQGGQGSSNAGHINGWDIPLMPRDDRPPLATDQVPFWDKNPIEMRNIPNIDLTGPSSSTTPKQKTDAQTPDTSGNSQGETQTDWNAARNSKGKGEAITSWRCATMGYPGTAGGSH